MMCKYDICDVDGGLLECFVGGWLVRKWIVLDNVFVLMVGMKFGCICCCDMLLIVMELCGDLYMCGFVNEDDC